jgi:hypothetical protein
VYRYRLVDESNGQDRGPFVSQRTAFEIGEEIARSLGEQYAIVNVVPAGPAESFHAYLVVRAMSSTPPPPASSPARG